MWRLDEKLVREDIFFLDRPYSLEKSDEEAMNHTLQQLESILEEHGEKIAAMILEPIQGNGGIIMYHRDFIIKAKALLEHYGVLLIVDEVQTGYGRTGKMFGINHYEVVPDIIVTAKALGNGIPISTFSTTDAIAQSFNKASSSTFGGNPVAATTALSVLNNIEQHGLVQRAEELGSYLKERLQEISSPFIQEIRGVGLMLGLQIQAINDEVSSAQITDIILEEMKDRGFLIGKNGLNRDCLAFQPPLVIEKDDLNAMLSNLIEVLSGILDRLTVTI